MKRTQTRPPAHAHKPPTGIPPGEAFAVWFARGWVAKYPMNVRFNETVLEHFRNPHNAGDVPDATAVVEVVNPVCGDVLRLSVRMEAGRVAEARFKTQGCVAAIASSSVLTDLLVGKPPSEFRSITPQQISEALEMLPPSTFHAAQLCADALAALFVKLA